MDSLGNPVANAAVNVISVSGSAGTAVTTDALGNYSTGPISQGTYDVVVRPSGNSYTQTSPMPRVVATSSTTYVQNVTVYPASAVITGTVSDSSGASPSNTNVFLLLNNSDNTIAYTVAATTPTAGGSYTLPAAPSTYTFLQFMDKNAFPSSTTYYQRSEYHSDTGSSNPNTFTVPSTGRSENATMASLSATTSTATCVTPTATITPVASPTATPIPFPTPGKTCTIGVSGGGYTPSGTLIITLNSNSGSGGSGFVTPDASGSIPAASTVTINNASSGAWRLQGIESANSTQPSGTSQVLDYVETIQTVTVP
jgi:hypothetical protein